MSGHSKWSTIKRQKGAADQKRGVLFTKLSNAITVAVKQGGSGDPAANFRLRLAVDAAKTANMPKDNIDRAIQKALGKGDETVLEKVYEGFGPGGFSVIVEAVTNNTNRTSSEIKGIFEKNGGSFGSPGAVAYQFESKGEIIVDKTVSLDELFMLAAESGAEDVKDTEDGLVVYTSVENLHPVQEALKNATMPIQEAAVVRIPIVNFELADDAAKERAVAFMGLLEEHPDVSGLYANAVLA